MIKYCNSVTGGETKACIYIMQACRNFLSDLDRKDIYFDETNAERVVEFIAELKHIKGEKSMQNIRLEPWQVFTVANIFGWYRTETGCRRYTNSYIEVARKNGKSILLAAMCLYALLADGEYGAEVVCAANGLEQAHILFDMCRAFARQLDSREKYVSLRLNELRFASTESKLKAVHSDARRLDGLNVSFGVCDELHAFPDSSIFDVLQSSQVSRLNRHLCAITTAGFDESGFCYTYRQQNIDNLLNRNDDTLFTMIFTHDNRDEWKDRTAWIKSNPNLGVSVNSDFLESMRMRALNNPSETVPVKTKNFNIWCQTANVWLPSEDVAAVMKPVDWDALRGCRTFIGVDLASTSDLTALAWLVFDENLLPHAGVKYYLPSASIERSVNAAVYRTWIQHGHLTVTNGNVTDYDRIIEDILVLRERFSVEKIGYDRYNATDWAIRCTHLGLPVEAYSQTIGNFNMPTKEMERRILGGHIVIENNPITRFCFENVNLKTDYNFNVKPSKSDPNKKIDGVIALIQSLGCYLATPRWSNTI